MSVEVIPAGSSAIVTERDHNRDSHFIKLMEAIKDAEANGRYATKDAEANLQNTVKDAEASLQDAAGMHYADTVKTIKDTEAALDRATGDRFVQLVQDVKDAESRLDRAAGDRFIQTIQDIKEAQFDTVNAKGQVIETVKDAEYELEKSLGHTREVMQGDFGRVRGWVDDVEDVVQSTRKEVLVNQLHMAKEAEANFWKLSKQSLEENKEEMLQAQKLFGESTLQAEKLYAASQAKAAECCCELKQAIAADGQKTRDLINSIEQANLRSRAEKAEASLSAYFSAKVAPLVP